MEISNWQTDCNTLRDRSKHAFEHTMFCDIELCVDDEFGLKVNIPANRYVLSLTSPFFAAMFYGQLAVKDSVINLSDCSKDAMNQVLCFAHTDEVSLTENNVMEVLYLADKFIIPSLIEKCRLYLKKQELEPEDVLNLLPQIQKIGDKNLQEFFWSIVEVKTVSIFKCPAFLDIPRELLCQVLQRDILDIQEIEIFKAVDQWARLRIKEKALPDTGMVKRGILGLDVIRALRFPIMTQAEFASIVLPCKILINCELIELFQSFNNVNSETNFFSKKERVMGSHIFPSLRFNHINEGWFLPTIGNRPQACMGIVTDSLDFTVNMSVYLSGVVLFGKQNKGYDVSLTIYKNNQVVHETGRGTYMTEARMIDNMYFGFTVDINKPLRLDPSDVCSVKASLVGELAYRGSQGNEVVTASDGFAVSYKKSKHGNTTDVEKGQFPTFVFRKIL